MRVKILDYKNNETAVNIGNLDEIYLVTIQVVICGSGDAPLSVSAAALPRVYYHSIRRLPMDWNTVITNITEWGLNTGIKILIAILILIVSFIIINFVAKRIRKKIEKSGKLDTTIGRVLVNAGKILAKCIVVICLVGYLGINTSALSALIASAGVCIGLAVNGALGNIAGGVLLLVTRPFKVDDFVEVDSQWVVTDADVGVARNAEHRAGINVASRE